MTLNILNSIRRSARFSFFMVGMLSNLMVFAEPATRAIFNSSDREKSETLFWISDIVPWESEVREKRFSGESHSNRDHSGIVKHSPEKTHSFIRIDANRTSGKVGISAEETNDVIQDNFFNFYIPESFDLSKYQTILEYELFGLLTEEGTTKSINGSIAYGGRTIEKDEDWKVVTEFLPQTLLKNGNNEIFFNRYTDSIYEYALKNVSLKLYTESNETVFQAEITHQRVFNLENEFVSARKNLQDSTDFNLPFYELLLKPQTYPEEEAVIEVSGLPFKDVKPLDQDLLNVTAGDFPAYRIQGKDSIAGDVEIFLAYDFQAIPEGYSPKDIRTYYFDKINKSWKSLPVAWIDSDNRQIVSLISDPGEGTDYINGIIKVPEHPETTNFVPTSIKDMDYADPTAGVVSIPPPGANHTGSVTTSFPIKIPPGRNGMQPSLEVVYNSEAGNGWMGMGWNMDIPALTLNTKWGVPVFDSSLESEIYMLNGQDLVFEDGGDFTAAHRDPDKKRTERIFYLRKEGSYLEIIRHGNSTSNYWWEVTDKFGNKSFYGGTSGVSENHVLRDSQGTSGNIIHWSLMRQEDPYGNYIAFTYDKKWETLSNGISGWTHSIKNIQYTLHKGNRSQNFYQIDFIKNDNRNDMITSARTGVMQLTNHLLEEIVVSLREGLQTRKVRSYHFDYADAAFGKKHLVKISEYDSEDRLFYSNSLEYFEADDNDIISDVVENWSGSNDDVSSVLQKIATGGIAGLIPSGSVLGTNVSSGFSFGMRVGVGVGANGSSVANTIGGSYNYQSSNQESRISFMDINGDGLPDKIHTNSSRVYYRPNTGSGFGDRIQLSGINSLDKTKSRTNGFGVDANLFGLIGAGASTSKTKSMTDHYFVDVNGDGLPDMISNNRVKFNTTRVNSDRDWREFSNFVQNSENPIEAGMVHPELMGGFKLETLEELRALHPQFDHVKGWRAPYSGNISISGTAQLLEENECNRLEASNDFRITIERSQQHNSIAQLIKSQPLTEVPTPVTASIANVQKGDFIFFRIHNLEYGCGGEAEWNPIISYTSGTPSGNDEQGKPFNLYQAKEDYIMNNGSGWEPEREDYTLTGYFNLGNNIFDPYQFSDDIDFIVERIVTDITTGESWIDESWTKTRTLEHSTGSFDPSSSPNNFSVNLAPAGDLRYSLRFYARSDSNVSWDEINWQPSLLGNQTYFPPISYRTYDDNIHQSSYQLSSNSLPAIPNVIPTEEKDSIVTISHNLFSLPSSQGNFRLMIYLNALAANDELPLKVNWLIKEKSGVEVKSIHKRSFYLIQHNGNFVFSQSPSSYVGVETLDGMFTLTKGYIHQLQQDQGILYSAFFVENKKAGVFDDVEIVFENHPDAVIDYPMTPITFEAPMMAFSPAFYGISYRGWGQFLYNGGLNFTLNEEGDLQPGSSFDGPIDMDVFSNIDPDMDPDDVQQQIDDFDPESVEIEGGVMRYSFYAQNNENLSYTNSSIINSFYGFRSNESLTASLGRFGESDLYDIYIDENDLLDGEGGLFIGFKQLSESKGTAISGELVTVTGTESKSTSNLLNQYIDLNGDRYPDIVTNQMIQFTGMDGGLSSKNIVNNFVSGSKNLDHTVGVTVAPMQPNSDDPKLSKNPIIVNTQAGINGGSGTTSNAHQWIDMNGDGLPDQVLIEQNSVKVSLNTGYGFSNEVIWASGSGFITSSRENVGIGMGSGQAMPKASFAFGFGGATSTAEIQTLLMDVNGDGLPDLIRSNGTEYSYYLNTGNGIDMTTPMTFCESPSIERDFSVSGNIFAAFTVGVTPLFLKITFTPSVGADASFSEKVYAIQDIDGDGLPDLLYKTRATGNGSLHARLNQSGKSHLLKKVNTPLGGHWEVDYARVGNTYDMPQSKWVIKELRTYDGFTGDNEYAPDRSLMKFTYQNGKQDRRERDFYGFETLKSELCNPDNEEVLRSTVQRFHTENYYIAGKIKETSTYNAENERLTGQKYFYNLRKPDVVFTSEMNTHLDTPFIESGLDLDRTRVVTPLVKTIHTEYEVNGDLNIISEMAEYDGFGNITKFVDYGMGGVDAYFTMLEYGHAFQGLPTDMFVYALNEPSVALRKRMATYNAKGKLEELITHLDETNQNTVAMEYDDYGNLKKITQPDNRDLTNTQSYAVNLKYDSFVHTYPVEISNAFNETSTFVYDYFYGFPVLQTDVNGNSIRTRIDQRGRPIDIAGPYEYHGSGLPTTSWIIRKEYPGELPVEQQLFGSLPTDYRIAGAQGSFEAIAPGDPELQDAQHFARTRHRDPLTLGNEFVTVSIVDGFGQAIQLKKKHNKDGTNLVWQISGKEVKDALGRVIAQYLPTTQTFSAQATEYVTGTGGQPMTIAYDDKDRETEITQPGESSSTEIVYSIEDNLLKTGISNELDQTQSNFTDIRGRLHKTILNDEITTRFFYNAINEQIKVRDNAGNETRYRYDMAGRRIEEEHPDRGKTLFTYDNANRLIKKQTANDLEQSSNHSIEYAYDFGRLVEITYPQHPENNVTYEYGSSTSSPSQSNHVGRLISQTDATGMQFFSYGRLGELTKHQRSVAVAGKTFYWFETSWEYDSWGRIKKITYPDNEEVSYQYDPAGQLQAMATNLGSLLNGSAPAYIVEDITYTELGERKTITYGNGTTNTYTYDNRRRLNSLKHEFSEFSMERNYQYDPLSNITGISSTGATSPTLGALGGPVDHSYVYDNYNRLIYADGYYVGPDDAVPDMLKQVYSLDMEYDLSHNILEKNQVHQFGSVSTINQSLPAEARHALTSYKLEYSGYGNSPYAHGQPHAPRRITEYPQEDYSGDPDDPRIKRKRIEYDANGNQLEIQEEVKDPGSPQGYHLQSLRKNLWDAEDRLRAVDLDPEADADKPLVAIYTYDAGGERTIKYVPARIDARYSAKEAGSADRLAATIYPSALLTAKILPIPEEGYAKGGRRVLKYTKHYYIGSERIASFLGTRQDVGLYCDSETMLIPPMDAKVLEAGDALGDVFTHFDKTFDLDTPHLYGSGTSVICGPTQITQGFGAYWYHPDHLGSSSYNTNLQGKISQHMEYLPFGETMVEEHLNSNNSPYKFNAKEFDAETGNYYYGARYYSPKYNLMLSVDPAYEMYPGVSPFVYTLQNPVRYVDPTGMFVEDNPVFSSDGTYRGNTIEGYTGDILIYDGDLDFSQMSAHELEFNIDDGATHYDFKRHELSGEAKSKIWTHVVSQLEGMKIYDETFSMDDLTGGKIHFDGELKDNWAATYILGRRKGTIRGSDKYNYETTVENLQSSIGVHEWYSHIKKNQGDDFKSHRLAYKNVINFKSLWNNTTKNYKEYNMWGLREYNWRETGRKTVDKPYLRLSNQYNELKNRFK